jgi:citrate lyase gamma subunit
MMKIYRHCEEGVARRGNLPQQGGDCFVAHSRSLLAMTVILLAVAASALLITKQVRAQSGIEMQSTAVHQFGEQITFVAQVVSPVQIQQANIVIFDEAQAVTHVQAVDFVSGRSEYRFDTQQNRVRPFAVIRWYYELTLSDASVLQSDSYSMRYDDNRFAWQKLESGMVRVFWAQGDAAFGQTALNVAQSGLQIINGIVPVGLTQPVDLFIYPTQNELAIFSGAAWEAGHAYADASVALVAIELDSNQSVNMERLIPHELMHVMLQRQLGNQRLPTWLNEGIATLAEINPTADYGIVLQDASNRNALIPIADLCASFPADSAQAFLAYAEARSFTTYLRDTYGAPALLNLARTYAEGVDCENGVQRALGVSLSQLDMDWRENSLGQNVWGVAFRNMLPYLVLLALLIFIPLIVGLNATRQKADKHGPEKYTNKR